MDRTSDKIPQLVEEIVRTGAKKRYGIALSPNQLWLAQLYTRRLVAQGVWERSAAVEARLTLLQRHYGLDEFTFNYFCHPKSGQSTGMELLGQPAFIEYCRRHQNEWLDERELL
jgi:hypothetical protein